MLRWSENSTPISPSFDDIYYAKEDGLAESRYVFLKHNGLPAAWDNQNYFHIAELGFGTGLNFLATLALWKTRQRKEAWLHFSSFEKFPLKINEIKRALAAWPELTPASTALLLEYEELPNGVHRLEFEDEHAILDLWIGDAVENISQFQGPVDAWYFDGFAPQRNPDLWNQEIFLEAARVAKENSTFATYTSASSVRRNLLSANYSVEKAPGYGRKREMLFGRMQKKETKSLQSIYPHRRILGGGIAGLSLATRFSARGSETQLHEKSEDFLNAGSGNPAALVMPNLTTKESTLSLYSLQSTLYTIRQYNRWQRAGHELGWHPSGVLQLLTDPQKEERFLMGLAAHRIPPTFAQLVSRDEASDIAGITIKHPAIFWRKSGFIEPQRLKKMLILKAGKIFSRSTPPPEAEPSIICTAEAALQLLPLKTWPWKFQRGQISFWNPPARLQKLRVPLVYGGYLLPTLDQKMMAGSTYNSPDLGLQLLDEDHAQILKQANEALQCSLEPEVLGGRAAHRLGLRDALPIVGPWENHLLSIGFGSKGFSHALLAGEILASESLGLAIPLQTAVREALLARRFAIQNQAVLSS